MSSHLKLDQKKMHDGVQGLISTLELTSKGLPLEVCPKLKTDLEDIEDLAIALKLMARKLRHSGLGE